MRTRAGVAAVALAALATPRAAQAHLVATGLGPVYDGVAHFALSAEDVLPVIALALFAGLRGPAHARLLLFTTPAAWFAGGALAAAAPWTVSPLTLQAAAALTLLALGGLLALDPKLGRGVVAAIAVGVGLVRGAADATGLAAGGGGLLSLVGMSAAVFAGFALAASVSLPLHRPWTLVAVRVVGSWLAAVGLLLAGWTLRYGAIS